MSCCTRKTWHERLLLKIHAYNESRQYVALAAITMAADEDYQETATEEQYKKAREEHAKKVDKFWAKTDPAGAFAMERAEAIRKKHKNAEKADEQAGDK